MKIQQHIIIVRSGTLALSSMGLKSAVMMQAVLSSHYGRVEIMNVSTLTDLDMVVSAGPDVVILGLKNLSTSAGLISVTGYLESYGINYLGSHAAAIALDYDKPAAKQAVALAGLRTAASYLLTQDDLEEIQAELSYPLFVKPPYGGGGQGIGPDSVVRNYYELCTKVKEISDNYHSAALVEAYLPGREFSVALMEQSADREIMALPIELIADQNEQGDRILGQAIKAADTERVTAVVDLALRIRINRLAVAAFRALGARDYGRIDIRLDAEGKPHFLEANLIPGLAKNDFVSYFISACEINLYQSYEAIILNLVQLSLNRYEEPSIEPTVLALA